MTDPYGQQPFGQQPGGQQPFGQPQPGQAPPPYGQPAPFGQAAPFGQQGTPFGAPRNYAQWGQRALGWLVDFGPVVLLYLIVIPASFAGGDAGSLLAVIGGLAWLGWTVYNRWIQQGGTGQSLGKRVAKIKLVREDTGQPVGAGLAFVRDLAHFVDNVICYVGWLWPLWDDKSQTLADKIMGTVVVQADAAPGAPFGAPQQAAGGYPPAGQFGQPAPGGYPQQSASGGFEQQSAPGGFGQPQPGGFGQQPASGGFEQQSAPGGFPQQPASGGFEQQSAPGGFGQPQPGGFGQQPQPGGFDQPQSGGFPPQPAPGGFGQPQPPSGGFPQPGQPLAPPPGGSAFDEQAERTQMLRPGAGGASAFDEQAERTQMLRPENQDEAEQTRKIDPGQFGQH
ncbi:putative RDD family membrane protein YckC [Amycolatopsis lexingtonensis]|uniref:RDD family membrane protein YckC n=1 Tax=Amycolatopsis lexingtonensis TaxID=218822 RepID=A0ABR9IGV1_9PSEU|nr:RDD family protein [Amycolatopsis lexingtonensis]MBE1502412.1 putative RDD family membrane protein YckC [Amycolatopsis lexingtonensis]